MNAVKTIKKVKNRKLTLKLPAQFDNLSVELIIIPEKKEKTNGIFALAGSLSGIDADIMASSIEDSRQIEKDNW